MKSLTHEQVLARLRKLQGSRTLEAFGRQIGVTPGYLSEVYSGKRGLGIMLLTYLRLVKNPPTYGEIARALPQLTRESSKQNKLDSEPKTKQESK